MSSIGEESGLRIAQRASRSSCSESYGQNLVCLIVVFMTDWRFYNVALRATALWWCGGGLEAGSLFFNGAPRKLVGLSDALR